MAAKITAGLGALYASLKKLISALLHPEQANSRCWKFYIIAYDQKALLIKKVHNYEQQNSRHR